MYQTDCLIDALSFLGQELNRAAGSEKLHEHNGSSTGTALSDAIEKSYYNNPWFIPSFVKYSFKAWADALQTEKIEKWFSKYPQIKEGNKSRLDVGVIMAGNIPMVGLHDLLCVIVSGHRALIRLSSSDNILIPAAIDILCHINPDVRDQVHTFEGPIRNANAFVATGSNNSSRYFDYYFRKYPHIIRKNRNGVAVITGNETAEEMKNLADDIFLYFGLGCRNVSKVFLPASYPVGDIFSHLGHYAFIADLHKYRNNYDYQKSILLINRMPHLDNGFLLVREDPSFISPVAVLHTESYSSIQQVAQKLAIHQDQIQCIISGSPELENAISPGCSQLPELWDYADGVDTLGFLLDLGKNKGNFAV